MNINAGFLLENVLRVAPLDLNIFAGGVCGLSAPDSSNRRLNAMPLCEQPLTWIDTRECI
jgi:hypothetical protein